jgi:hypothetical protein
VKDNGTIRISKTGATRDTSNGKNDYEGFNNPLVELAFGDYMTEHRIQSDGSLRDSDNWQQGFGETPKETKDIMIKSGLWNEKFFNKTDFTYRFQTGSIIEFFSVDNPSKALGSARDYLFINECKIANIYKSNEKKILKNEKK